LAFLNYTFGSAMTYLLLGIVLFIAYRFITGFVIPVAKTTTQVRQQFQSMKEQMEKAQQQQQNGGRTPVQETAQKPKFDVEGEYIPFEDVK
jgi:uncharacterized membrane protein